MSDEDLTECTFLEVEVLLSLSLKMHFIGIFLCVKMLPAKCSARTSHTYQSFDLGEAAFVVWEILNLYQVQTFNLLTFKICSIA